jgi:hypothetical protein
VLRELQEKPHHRKGLGLSLVELVAGAEGDHSDDSVLEAEIDNMVINLVYSHI